MVTSLAERSIASSTHRSYASAWRAWEQFIAEQGLSAREARRASLQDSARADAASTLPSEFLAWLHQSDTRSADTISSYKSAMRTRFALDAPGRPNPWDHPRVEQVRKGIERERAAREAAAREQRRLDDAGRVTLTPDALATLCRHLTGDGADQICIRAALHLGVYALMRPSELLGSTQHPERRLRADQLTLHDARGTELPAPGPRAPDHVRVHLIASKTDQRGRRAGHPVHAPSAVDALWRWLVAREQIDAGDPALFLYAGRPLTTRALHGHLRVPVMAAFGQHARLDGGKSWRRGGASAALLLDGPPEDRAALGRWAPRSRMVERYARDEAHQQRFRNLSRSLDPSLRPSPADDGAADHT